MSMSAEVFSFFLMILLKVAIVRNVHILCIKALKYADLAHEWKTKSLIRAYETILKNNYNAMKC